MKYPSETQLRALAFAMFAMSYLHAWFHYGLFTGVEFISACWCWKVANAKAIRREREDERRQTAYEHGLRHQHEIHNAKRGRNPYVPRVRDL